MGYTGTGISASFTEEETKVQRGDLTWPVTEPSKGLVQNPGLLAPRGRLCPLTVRKQGPSLRVDLWVGQREAQLTGNTNWWCFQQERVLRDNEGGLRVWGGAELPLGLRLGDPISPVLPEATQRTLLSSHPGGASLGLLVPQPPKLLFLMECRPFLPGSCTAWQGYR